MTPARSKLQNIVFITLVVVTNTFSNLFLARGLDAMPRFSANTALVFARALLSNAWFLSGVALLTICMVAQLSMFTWADLSYVLPMTASTYAFTAILGKFLLGESVSAPRWAGIALISVGVLLVSETPPWTHTAPPGVEA